MERIIVNYLIKRGVPLKMQGLGLKLGLNFRNLRSQIRNSFIKKELKLSPSLYSVEFFPFFQFFLSKFMSDIPSKFSNTSVTSPFIFAIFDMNNSDYILVPATFRTNSFFSLFLNHI